MLRTCFDWLKDCGASKVNHVQLLLVLVRADSEVLGLHISVEDASSMHLNQPCYHLQIAEYMRDGLNAGYKPIKS